MGQHTTRSNRRLLTWGTGAAVALMLGAALAAPNARADEFIMCPSGHEGVVGGHTSCSFAAVVHDGANKWGLHFNAVSPETGLWYHVDCDPYFHTITFVGGAQVSGDACYASTNAEVVIW